MDLFKGRLLQGDRVLIEHVEGIARPVLGPDVQYGGRITSPREKLPALGMNPAEYLTLEKANGEIWNITITNLEGGFLTTGIPPKKGT